MDQLLLTLLNILWTELKIIFIFFKFFLFLFLVVRFIEKNMVKFQLAGVLEFAVFRFIKAGSNESDY